VKSQVARCDNSDDSSDDSSGNTLDAIYEARASVKVQIHNVFNEPIPQHTSEDDDEVGSRFDSGVTVRYSLGSIILVMRCSC